MKVTTKYIQEIYILESSEMKKNYFNIPNSNYIGNSKKNRKRYQNLGVFSYCYEYGAIVGSNCNIGEHVFIEDGVTLCE